MKKSILIPVTVFGIYVVFYFVVRVMHQGTISMMVADTQGAYHAQTFQATCFVAPKSGFERFSSRVLFDLFYPLGQFDHFLNGRLYAFADQREEPIMKPKP